MRREKSRGRSNTYGTRSSPRGPSATSTTSTPSSAAGETRSPTAGGTPTSPTAAVADVWAEEKPRLLPLPAHPFETDLVRVVRSGKTPYVRFDRNLYSIPHTHVRKPLTLVAGATRIRILDGQTELTNHHRTYDTGLTVEDPAHLENLLAATRQANAHTTRDRLRAAVPATATLFERLAERGEALRPNATRLLALLDDYGQQELAAAVARPSNATPSAPAPSPTSSKPDADSADSNPRCGSRCPTDPDCETSMSGPMTWSPTMPSDRTALTTLATDLRRLGLNRTADELNDRIAEATRKRWSATVLLEHLVADELEDKQRRSVESRLTRARLGRFKPLADWNWEWPTALDRLALERILTLDFLARGENVILVGAQGLGKTMLAKNIAHQAVLAGHSALFTTAADLLLNLNGQETGRALERRLRHYTRPTLLVIDELGYLAYDARAADLIFQLVSRRYEHRSLLITTNLPFKRWDTVFPNASCAVALIDRLTHHVEILLMIGTQMRVCAGS